MQGSRSVRGQRSDFAASAPVRMKPLESTAMLGGSQSVLGCAPMKTNTAEQSRSRELAVPDVAEPEPRDRAVALDGVHLDVADDLDFRVTLDPAGEVVGHALAQVTPAQAAAWPRRCARRGTSPPGPPSCRRPPRRRGRSGTTARAPRCRNRRSPPRPNARTRRREGVGRWRRWRSGPSGRVTTCPSSRTSRCMRSSQVIERTSTGATSSAPNFRAWR